MIPFYKHLEKIEADHDDQHRLLFRFAWTILPDITSTVPTTTTLQPNFAQIYLSGTTYRIYFNINNSLYYWNLTKV